MGSLLDWIQILTLIVVAVAAVSLIVFGYFRSSRQPPPILQGQNGPVPRNGDGRAEFLSALRNASEEIMGDLDARVTSTRELLREADERIAVLADLLARLEQTASSGQRSGGQQPADAQMPRPAASSPGGLEQGKAQAEKERSSGDIDKSLAAHEGVRTLAREGKRPEEIAKTLGMGTGEVLLILGLSRRV